MTVSTGIISVQMHCSGGFHHAEGEASVNQLQVWRSTTDVILAVDRRRAYAYFLAGTLLAEVCFVVV